jgi:hypothetical protein
MSWKWAGVLVCAALAACDSHKQSATVRDLPNRPTSVAPFDVTVELTPRAAAQLKERGETIIVFADFYGSANARGAKYADHMGGIAWSKGDRVELGGPGVARFRSRDLNVELLNYFEKRKPYVLINVVSGRRTSKNNLLDCNAFEDSVYLAVKKGVRIACDLIH